MGGQKDAMVYDACICLNGMLGLKQLSKGVHYLEKGVHGVNEDCIELLALCKLIGIGTENYGREAF